MKIRILRASSFVLGLLLLALAPALAQFRVIGYLPSWTGDVNAVQYGKLTHINYAFLLPNSDGSVQAIDNPTKLQSLVAKAHASNVKVLISVGGWMNGNPAPFESIGGNAGYTNTFATNLVNFVNQYGLDGVDIDWEHPNANTANAYASLMQKLATEMHSRGKLLTTAVAGGAWEGPGVLPSVFGNVDFMNIMAYDDTPPNHSTYALASQSITYWQGRGLPKSKTVLGVPFYAQPSGTTYADLLAQGADPNADLFNNQGYNGIPTIKSKTNLAFDQASGIMIWQLAGDAVGTNSLLTAINQVVLSRGTPPPTGTGVATFYKDCNYTGTAVALPVGDYPLSALQAKGIANDDISSLQLSSGYQVVLYESDNYSGGTLTLTASNSCLVNNALATGNWNDKTTSLRVQAASASFSRQLEAEAANVNSGMTAETTTDTGGGQNMGYVDASDYLVFNNINFPATGSYTIEYRVASPSGGTVSSDLNAGSMQLGSTTIPTTGGWQTWTTVSKTVTINAGTYNFGVYAQTGGYNINWVRITKVSGAREAAPTATASTASQPAAISLYPNPVADRLTVDLAAAYLGGQVSIRSVEGKEVWRGAYTGQPVDVSGLRAGLYILTAQGKDQPQVVSRFTKQ
jgi:chitinase